MSLAVAVNRHALSLICTCLVEDFDAILALLADIVMQPTFPAPRSRRGAARSSRCIRQDEDNPAAVAVDG